MKLWRKVGSGFKSNILILITVALWHKVTQSADALAHLISFMSWRIWITQDTRVKQKVISASVAICKPCGVEVKLQVKIVTTNSALVITENTQLSGTMENSSTEFSVKMPTWTNTSGFEQSVEVRTGTKSESGLVNGFPSMNISPGRDHCTVFTSFLVSHLTDACILLCYSWFHCYVYTRIFRHDSTVMIRPVMIRH